MHALALSFVGNLNYLSILFAFFEIHCAIILTTAVSGIVVAVRYLHTEAA
jgi:hypothetical protein